MYLANMNQCGTPHVRRTRTANLNEAPRCTRIAAGGGDVDPFVVERLQWHQRRFRRQFETLGARPALEDCDGLLDEADGMWWSTAA